jgi:hypothetical protein
MTSDEINVEFRNNEQVEYAFSSFEHSDLFRHSSLVFRLLP